MRFSIISIHLLVLLFLPGALLAAPTKQNKKITLVTHEAAPFMDEKLPDQGALCHALRKAFTRMGYDLNMFVLNSWTRTKIKAVRNEEIDGYAPYASKENEELFDFSDTCYDDPWVIVERKDHPIQWKVPEDLIKYKAGNVQGVEFRPPVKPLVDSGKLTVISTNSDENNIRLLAAQRVDFIFIDKVIFNYYLATDPKISPFRSVLQVNAQPITISHYGIAIKKGHLTPGFMKEFNKQCKMISKDVDDYLEEIEKKK